MAGEEVATCPSCSLIIKVIYDLVSTTMNMIATAHDPVQPADIFVTTVPR